MQWRRVVRHRPAQNLRIVLENGVNFFVVAKHQGFEQPNGCPAIQQFLGHLRPIPMNRKHQRRPKIVSIVTSVNIGPGIQNQPQNIHRALLHRHMNRLRPAAPPRMRSRDVHKSRLRCKRLTNHGFVP